MLTEELEILDTWHTLGLRGTGSHDAVADELFVPASRVLSLFDGPLVDRPLYRFPIFGDFALSIAAAALGNARGAIEEFASWQRTRSGRGPPARSPSARRRTRASPRRRRRCARRAAFTTRRSTPRGTLPRRMSPCRWRCATTCVSPPPRHAHRRAGGREPVRPRGRPGDLDESPLQRRFRDAHTATAHFQVNAASHELQGRILLDQPTDTRGV